MVLAMYQQCTRFVDLTELELIFPFPLECLFTEIGWIILDWFRGDGDCVVGQWVEGGPKGKTTI